MKAFLSKKTSQKGLTNSSFCGIIKAWKGSGYNDNY